VAVLVLLTAGNSGQIVDMKELGVWEPYAVRSRCWHRNMLCVCRH
jgi:hypothetical protein